MVQMLFPMYDFLFLLDCKDSFAVLPDPDLRIGSLEVLNLVDDDKDDFEDEAAGIIALYGAGVVQVATS